MILSLHLLRGKCFGRKGEQLLPHPTTVLWSYIGQIENSSWEICFFKWIPLRSVSVRISCAVLYYLFYHGLITTSS